MKVYQAMRTTLALSWLATYTAFLAGGLFSDAPPRTRFAVDLCLQLVLPLGCIAYTQRLLRAGVDSFIDHGSPSLRSLAFVAPVLVLTQIVFGALLRHGLFGALWHVLGAMLTGAFLLYLGTGVMTPAPMGHPARKLAVALLWVTLTQVMLGIGAYVVKFGQGVPSTMLFSYLHILTGTATLATTAMLSLYLRHCVSASSGTREAANSPSARTV